MHKKYIFSNVIGTFIFNEHFKQINKILFKNIEDFQNKEKFEASLKDKYKNLSYPEGYELKKILEFFKNENLFDNFYKKNLFLTKKAIKESVSDDLLVVQTINNITELDRIINTLTKRLREWYEFYNPELSKKINDNKKFSELVLKEKKQKDSIGSELSKENLNPLVELSKEINSLYKFKDSQLKYLENLMRKICPNMVAITGVSIGAKLLEHAGSLKKLTEMPASTIQLLGAEKALFRHIKNKKNLPPKYGILHEHPLISKAKKKVHGKIARTLADKISIAIKVDYFKGEFIGDKLRKEIEKRVKND